jgi:hypothetical protein
MWAVESRGHTWSEMGLVDYSKGMTNVELPSPGSAEIPLTT